MPDISKIQLTDEQVYNIKDNELRYRLEQLLGNVENNEERQVKCQNKE